MSDSVEDLAIDEAAVPFLVNASDDLDELFNYPNPFASGEVPLGNPYNRENHQEVPEPGSDIEQEVKNELISAQQVPRSGYICHRCFRPGHIIQNCPTRTEGVTPYQGIRKSVGFFSCSKCKRHWRYFDQQIPARTATRFQLNNVGIAKKRFTLFGNSP